jgi:acyl-CoA synthetase (AMP-forming)/AMP-acid ligase II/acyl carrier protein
MHWNLLDAAFRSRRRAGRSLRFVRSGSARLSADLMGRLEDLWGVPVVESYGMTEAHQIASNPLPPGLRKPGTVGVPTGSEVAILNRDGPVGPGEVGEILVRGPNVVTEYLAPPEVNEAAFINGWLRTGDTGFLDEDGYLTVTGRMTEMINRGGEKVQPHEVDAVLEEHPAVAQSAAFGVPHPTLIQEVAAAVVLRPGTGVGPGELERFAADRLAPHKLPRRIVVLDSLPTHSTGKVQRNRLAEELGMTFGEVPGMPMASVGVDAPRSPMAAALVGIWAEALERVSVGVDEDFFACGGDSLSGLRLLAMVREVFGVEIPPMAMYDETSTVARMAGFIERSLAEPTAE